MKTKKTMNAKNLLVLLMAVFALTVVVPSVSAFGDIIVFEVNGIEILAEDTDLVDFAEVAGDTLRVRVVFNATENAEDVRIAAWISGNRRLGIETDRFDVVAGRVYIKTFDVPIPTDLDEESHEDKTLFVSVENDEQEADEATVNLTVQRESYLVEVLNVDMQPEVKAGELLAIDVVLKNRGSHLAEDTFVKVRIPELGLETTTFYGDLSPKDQGGNVIEREDSSERRTFLRVPLSAPAGLYTVLIEAYNSDSLIKTERRINVVGAGQDTRSVSAVSSKTFSAGETAQYQLTLVNTGSVVRVYELTVDAPTGFNVDVSEPVVVVPAGSSRTVTLRASSSTEGSYAFTANVNADGQAISSKTFRANVEEARRAGRAAFGSTAVLLTVILAIIFVVLLVVLIVLLTRKPEQKEEFGESYY